MDGRGAGVSCPRCGQEECPPSREFRSGSFALRTCPRCEDRFVWPAPPLDRLRAYYRFPTYGRVLFGGAPTHTRRRIADLSRWIGEIEADLGGVGRLLDVGASTGMLLSAAKERGWAVTGIEIDEPTARRTADQLRVPVQIGSGLDALGGSPPFDLIAMSHWLEHVPDPGHQLALARRRLSPGGRIWVRAPNADSRAARLLRERWAWFCPPIHLQYFTPRSFAIAAPRAGLELRWSRTLRGDGHPLPLELMGGLVKLLTERTQPKERGTELHPAVGAMLSTYVAPLGDRIGRWNPLDRWEDSELQVLLRPTGNMAVEVATG